MKIDEDGIGATLQAAGFELMVDGVEGAIEIAHEHAAHGVHHEHVGAVRGLVKTGTPARRPFGKVEGSQHAVVALDEDKRLALIPNVVAGGDDVGARIEKVDEDRFGNAKPAGRVLAIDHDEMRAVPLAQAR